MRSHRPPGLTSIAAGVAVAAVTLVVTYLALERSVERMLEDAWAAQAGASVRVLASHIRGHVEDLADALREIAPRCATQGAPLAGECATDLDRLRRQQPRLFVATIMFDAGGRPVETVPPRAWRPEELAAAEGACARLLSGGEPVQVAVSGSARDRTVFAVAHVGGGAEGRVRAIGVALDGAELASALLEGMIPGDQGLAFVAAEDGRLVAVSGVERSRQAASLDDLIGPGWSRMVRGAGEPEGEARRSLRLASGQAGDRMVGVLEPVRLAGGGWVIGALVPARSVRRGAEPVLFGGAILMAVLVAGAVAAIAGWRRAASVNEATMREAERWRGLAERRQREGRWRGLAEHALTPVVCLQGLRVVAGNVQAVALLGGGDREGLIGREFLEFVAEDGRAGVAASLQDLQTHGGTVPPSGVGLILADGRRMRAELTAAAVQEFDETLVYVAWREEAATRWAEPLLAAIAGSVPLALVLTDNSGHMAWANATVFERTGFAPAELAGRPLLPIVERSHHRVALAALAEARRGRPARGQLRVRCRGGEVLTAEFKAIPVSAADSRPPILFVLSEVGAPDAGARDFPTAARDRALSHLATSLANRVSNKFQALLGVLNELKTGSQPPGTLDAAQRLVVSSVEDLRRFVSVSRSGAGALRPVRLRPLVERWLEKASSSVPSEVRVGARLEARDDRVIADAGQITLWLEVSMAAALSAMELGGAVEVSVSEGHEPGAVRLVFSDTGPTAPGLAHGEQAELEHFSSRRTARALAELIATRHGGRTGGSFKAGIGGRLWIELPHPAPAAEAEERAVRRRRQGAVLVADDEEMVRATLATALRETGYEVVEAVNGLEAVEKVLAAPERFALVVLDLVMPVMDGREALRRLRAEVPALPVVVCTGYDPSGDDVLAAAGLLIKPFSLVEFLAKVTEMAGPGHSTG